MARPVSFKASDIINAANELNRSNKAINGTSLRKLIGTGRPDALMAAYSELLGQGKISTVEQKKEVAEVVEVRELPSEVEESLNSAVESLKKVVLQCNDIAHNTVESRLNAAIEKAKNEEILAAEEVEKANADLTAAYDEIEQLKEEYQAEIDALKQKFEGLKQTNAELNIELTSSKQSLSDQIATNADLSQNLASKSEQCKQAEQDAIVQKTKAEEMAKQLNSVQQANAELSSSMDTEKSLKAEQMARAEAAEATLAVAVSDKQETKEEIKALHQQLEQKAAVIAACEVQSEGDAKTIVELNKQIEQLQTNSEQES